MIRRLWLALLEWWRPAPPPPPAPVADRDAPPAGWYAAVDRLPEAEAGWILRHNGAWRLIPERRAVTPDGEPLRIPWPDRSVTELEVNVDARPDELLSRATFAGIVGRPLEIQVWDQPVPVLVLAARIDPSRAKAVLTVRVTDNDAHRAALPPEEFS